MRTATRIAAVLFCTSVGLGHAQAVRSERNISLDLANQIAAHTVAACSGAGYNVSATVSTAPVVCVPCSAPTTPARTRWKPAG